jgi:hypothetical protein
MDPNAAYKAWFSADEDEAVERHEALMSWLRKGGFEPEWSQQDKTEFLAWEPEDKRTCDVCGAESRTCEECPVGIDETLLVCKDCRANPPR